MPLYENASREELRKVYLNAWRKHLERLPLEPLEAQVATVIVEHPEYQALLEDSNAALEAEFSPEAGRINPFLHMALHLAVRDQVATDRPPGIREVFDKLARRRGKLEAEHAIGEYLAELLWQTDRTDQSFGGQPPSIDVYLRRVRKLLR